MFSCLESHLCFGFIIFSCCRKGVKAFLLRLKWMVLFVSFLFDSKCCRMHMSASRYSKSFQSFARSQILDGQACWAKKTTVDKLGVQSKLWNSPRAKVIPGYTLSKTGENSFKSGTTFTSLSQIAEKTRFAKLGTRICERGFELKIA